MQIGFAAVEQADERGVHMPDLVRPSGPDADRWLCWMHTLPRSTPVVGTHQSVPRGRRRKDFAEPLSQSCQCAGGDMPVFVCGNHVSDGQAFFESELLR